jgi:hypothetical protein
VLSLSGSAAFEAFLGKREKFIFVRNPVFVGVALRRLPNSGLSRVPQIAVELVEQLRSSTLRFEDIDRHYRDRAFLGGAAMHDSKRS